MFHAVTGVDYTVALTIGAVVILLYTFMGGFMAVCVTDFIQGMLMLVALLAVPLMAYAVVSGNGGLRELLDASRRKRFLYEPLAEWWRAISCHRYYFAARMGIGILRNASYPDQIYGGKEPERIK